MGSYKHSHKEPRAMFVRMDYLHRDRKTTNYIYRRSIPEDLREAFGRREFNRSLKTKDQSLAIRRYGPVHTDIEDLLSAAHRDQSPAAMVKVYTEWLRSQGFKPEFAMGDLPRGDREIEERLNLLDDLHERDLDGQNKEDDEPLTDPRDQPKVDLLLHGTRGLKIAPTLREGLETFIVERGRDSDKLDRDRRWRDFHKRSITLLGSILKKGVDTPIDEITRDDAIRWRDMMVAKYAPETVSKHYVTLKALFGHLFDVLEITKRNPFGNLTIKFDRQVLARDRKAPFNEAEESLIRSLLPRMNLEAQLVVQLMLSTGCRVTEACYLMKDDIVLDGPEPYIHIQENERNEWNLKGSFARKVPVVDPETLALLRQFPDGPTRYSKPRGAAGCSTTINKVFRENGLKDSGRKVSLYSARHALKSKLQLVQTPSNITDEILGHSSGGAKDGYGDGMPLTVTSEWLHKALGV